MVASLVMAITLAMVSQTATGPSLQHKIVVPTRYQNGEPELGRGWDNSDIARYIEGFERMWRECVAIRARDIDAEQECPLYCSGTPAASDGCAAGTTAANDRINSDVAKYGKVRVQEFLRDAIPPSN